MRAGKKSKTKFEEKNSSVPHLESGSLDRYRDLFFFNRQVRREDSWIGVPVFWSFSFSFFFFLLIFLDQKRQKQRRERAKKVIDRDPSWRQPTSRRRSKRRRSWRNWRRVVSQFPLSVALSIYNYVTAWLTDCFSVFRTQNSRQSARIADALPPRSTRSVAAGTAQDLEGAFFL